MTAYSHNSDSLHELEVATSQKSWLALQAMGVSGAVSRPQTTLESQADSQTASCICQPQEGALVLTNMYVC